MFRAVILGAPASGKGTISSRINKTFNILHVSSGDLLRNNILNNTELGVAASLTINMGKLIPDDLMLKLMLSELEKLHSHNWLLDGFPRTRLQGEALVSKYDLKMAIALQVPIEEIIERVKGRWVHIPSGRVYNETFSPPKTAGIDDVTGEALVQRPDDSPDAVRQRLTTYTENIQPLIDLFSECGILHRFVGSTSDEIWPNVRSAISKYLEPKTHKEC